jgi:probable F420-dependent oxidoreductase
MKFGLMYVNATAPGRDDALHLAREAERAGFESLWTVEHVVVPQGYGSSYPYSTSGRMARGAEDFDSPDPLVWLAAVAGVTSTIRLATGILILPQRNPLILAKEVASLDVLSGGRVTLGVGVGWLEEEFRALGVPFKDRGRRADEYIGALRTLWTQEVASFNGEFVAFDDVYCRPLPVQRPVPIVIGGHSRRAARRAGELGDGFFPASAAVEELPGLVTAARRAAEDSGRDPATLEITMGARPIRAAVEPLAEAGVDRVVVPAFFGLETLAGFAGDVMPEFT